MCCDFSRFLRVQNGCGVHCTASRICCYHIATNNVPSFIHKSKFDLAPSHITHIYANSSSITSLHRYKPPLLSACDCRPPLPGPYVRCLCSENGWHLFISAIRRIYGYNATIAAELPTDNRLFHKYAVDCTACGTYFMWSTTTINGTKEQVPVAPQPSLRACSCDREQFRLLYYL